MTRTFQLLLAGLSLAGIGFGLPASAQQAPAGDAAAGKTLYLANGCFECHGRNGQGGLYNGIAPILAQTQLPADAFRTQLREPSNDMPPYSEKVFTDKQVDDIYAFVRALPGPRNPQEIAILNH
jgi:mono/diheme cytochrome c family protein